MTENGMPGHVKSMGQIPENMQLKHQKCVVVI